MIEKFLEISMLYDFYGQMLTPKQREIFELYYNDDLSLGEISEAQNISRQGVYDIIKRSEKQLYHYEEKLGLARKFTIQKSSLKEAYDLLDTIGDNDKISKIKSLIREIIDTDI
jgi:Uncharacterized protein conserved in bacteria